MYFLKNLKLLRNTANIPNATSTIMSLSTEEKILALSTFFLVNDMSKSIKKAATNKMGSLTKKPTLIKKDIAVKKGKKPVSSSEESSESSDSSSEDEPPKKSKKAVVKKNKKKKPVSSSEESSSEEEEEVEVAKEAPQDGLFRIGEGLIAIAEQLAKSDERHTSLMELLTNVMAKLDARDQAKEVTDDLLEVIDDVVGRGDTIVIGNAESVEPYRFESVGHLRRESGRLASQSNFVKELSINEHDANVEEDITTA